MAAIDLDYRQAYDEWAKRGYAGPMPTYGAAPPAPPNYQPVPTGPNDPHRPGVQTTASQPLTDFGGGNQQQQQRQIADARGGQAPLGFDQTKWANPEWNTTKYRAGTILAGGGSIANVLADPQFRGWKQVGQDKIASPDGNVYDLYYDYGGPQQRVQYTQTSWGPNSDPRLSNNIRGDYAASQGRPLATRTGSGIPQDFPGGGVGGAGGRFPQGMPGDPGSYNSGYNAQFSDPSTRQYEGYLQTQIQALEAQRARQAQAQGGFQSQQADAQAATRRLTDFLGQRASQLQQPAYTGAEQEILRTQMLDPIERDRTAANQRALQNIGSRGFDPTSGIAQELIGQVNRGYDEQRARAQGELAYKQVNEKRSREQEAQALLGMIPTIQRGASGADLQFLQMLDQALNAPRQQGLQLSQMLYRLPAQAQADALAAMGMGPGTDSVYQQAMQLYNAQNQQAQQGLGYYQMLGSMLPYLLGGLGG